MIWIFVIAFPLAPRAPEVPVGGPVPGFPASRRLTATATDSFFETCFEVPNGRWIADYAALFSHIWRSLGEEFILLRWQHQRPQ
jgi:hypothetical protein